VFHCSISRCFPMFQRFALCIIVIVFAVVFVKPPLLFSAFSFADLFTVLNRLSLFLYTLIGTPLAWSAGAIMGGLVTSHGKVSQQVHRPVVDFKFSTLCWPDL